MSRRLATFIGFTAVLMWALLALFTAASGTMPPFQLAAISFFIGAIPGLFARARSHEKTKLPKNWRVWTLGIGGLFGYHFVYFTALRNAPAVEASLIAYLWPLLIVVFSGLLPGEKLKSHHLFGVILGLCGAGLVISGGRLELLQNGISKGHVLALACAFIWSIYSVLSRRFGAVATDIVGYFCLATSLLSAICHVIFETSIWPVSASEWLAILGLGLLPVGLAFYAWDYGVKHGDIQVLGASSYAAPLLSTLVLIAAGKAEFTCLIIIACVLITLGALIAAKDLWLQRN